MAGVVSFADSLRNAGLMGWFLIFATIVFLGLAVTFKIIQFLDRENFEKTIADLETRNQKLMNELERILRMHDFMCGHLGTNCDENLCQVSVDKTRAILVEYGRII